MQNLLLRRSLTCIPDDSRKTADLDLRFKFDVIGLVGNLIMKYWLLKSEPDVFSIDDLYDCKDRIELWDGIRNYQARNFMR